MRAFACGMRLRAGEGGNGLGGESAQGGGAGDEVQQGGVFQPVVNVTAFAPVGKDIRFTKSHQVLRDVRLTPAKHGFEMANAGFPFSDGKQNGNTL